MKKQFKALAVVGASSGRLLEHGKFDEIHQVFDHLYPGIMTLGVSAMADDCAAELRRQIPALCGFTEERFLTLGLDGFVRAATDELGDTLDVDGPIEVSESDIRARFDEMAARVSSKKS